MAPKEKKRGGSRNKAKDVVDLDHLSDAWLDLYKRGVEIFDSFGEYTGLWTECAPRGDLVDLIPIANAISKVSPGLQVGYGDLKECVTMCMNMEPSCKPKKKESVQEAAKHVADKLVMVQKHFRSIALNQGIFA